MQGRDEKGGHLDCTRGGKGGHSCGREFSWRSVRGKKLGPFFFIKEETGGLSRKKVEKGKWVQTIGPLTLAR